MTDCVLGLLGFAWPAVNLASRLESLTKAVGTHALFSDEVAKHVPALIAAGAHELKGIE